MHEDQPGINGVSEMLDPNSVLSPYLPNKKLYHCPADNYIDPNSGQVHIRSISMNSAVGTIYYHPYYNPDHRHWTRPVNGGWLTGSAYNSSQSKPGVPMVKPRR